jgi:hypothetical protein
MPDPYVQATFGGPLLLIIAVVVGVILISRWLKHR